MITVFGGNPNMVVVLRFFCLYMNNQVKHKEGTKCPSCNSTDKNKDGILIIRKSKISNKSFLGCSRYPECRYISPTKIILPGIYQRRAAYQSNVNSRPSYTMVGKSGHMIKRIKPNRG